MATFTIRTYLSKLLASAMLRVLYSKPERDILAASVRIVAGNTAIPDFDIRTKQGREYRRDAAAYQAYTGTGMKQSRVNLGVELAYWLLKEHTPELGKKHQPRQ